MEETLEIFHAALAAVDPGYCMGSNLRLQGSRFFAGPHRYDLDNFSEIIVVGAGKAAAGMGLAVESLLGSRISKGLLAVPRGIHAPFQRLSQVQSSHPLPDAAGEEASRRTLALLSAAGERTLVLCLLSGGASAMLELPAPGMTLADEQAVVSLLLGAGASIEELNSVRKHLSRVKGGRLAAAAFPATLLTLALSDVIGNRPEVIGSGPTSPDPGTFADAWIVLEKYRLKDRIPARARKVLERGISGRGEETVKPNDPRLARSAYLVIGSCGTALKGALEEAGRLGVPAEILTSMLQGEAREAGRFLAASALRAQARLRPGEKRCLLAGGETTVTVRGKGRGGRSQELALAFAREIAGMRGVEMLSAGTDGMDGPTDAAGAVVDGVTVPDAAAAGLAAAVYLENNDSYTFFKELDRRSGGKHHLKTGPTGTNVMDLQVILLRHPG